MHEYQELISHAQRHAAAELGEFAASGDVARALRSERGTRGELESVLSKSPDDAALSRMVAFAVSGERLLDELVRAYANDASKRDTAIIDERTFPSLVALEAHRLDVLVATVWVDQGFQFCIRLVRVFWTHDWLLTIWQPAGGEISGTYSYSLPAKWDSESAAARSAAVPARRPSHLPAGMRRDVGGREPLIRFTYFVAAHHEWSVAVTSETLVRWQSTFSRLPAISEARTRSLRSLFCQRWVAPSW